MGAPASREQTRVEVPDAASASHGSSRPICVCTACSPILVAAVQCTRQSAIEIGAVVELQRVLERRPKQSLADPCATKWMDARDAANFVLVGCARHQSRPR